MAHAEQVGTSVVEARNLGRTFRRRKTSGAPRHTLIHALKGIDLTITKGEIVGYVGVNGAGKSTTIKCLCGVLKPTTGSVIVNGIDTRKPRNQIPRDVGVVFGQKTQLYWDIPPIETYKWLKAIWGLSSRTFQETLGDLIEVFQIRDILDVPVRQLSLGQRMRCDLVASLLHNPNILFLDEPTIGMDYDSSTALRSHLKEINTISQTSIFLASHDLQDIESLAKRVIVIDSGQLIYNGSLDDLRSSYADYRIVMTTRGPWEAEIVKLMGDVITPSVRENRAEIRLPTDRNLQEVLMVLNNHGVLNDVSIGLPELGEVIGLLRATKQLRSKP